MIWVYGICDRPGLAPPRRRGLAQAPLEALREQALLAVFTRHAHSVGDPAPDALWAHERVVERLMADRTVLPMRFGSTVRDEGELRRFLAERQATLVAALARLAGRVELGVRMLAQRESGTAPAVASGRDYVLSKLRDGARADRVHEPLAALASDSRLQPPRGGDELLRGAYLVDRGAIPRFRTGVERLQHAHPEVAILCTGPWPPYTFANGA
jgi:hypothetical protein